MIAPFIQVSMTPNPSTRKFSFDAPISSQPYDATHMADHSQPLKNLLNCGLKGIFIGQDYLSLTKLDDAVWGDIEPKIMDIIKTELADFQFDVGDTNSVEETSINRSNDPVIAKILDIIDTQVRPTVAHDGGDIKFHSFENGVLKLEMEGACHGCPSSTATLKMGIKNMMGHFVPEVLDVEAFNQPSNTTNN